MTTDNSANNDVTKTASMNCCKYSVCITNYNSIDTIRDSMESIFKQLNSSFEIVVCDNCSNDGSREVLQEYAQNGRIKLIVERSSRGKGRQIAFENSVGEYIISGLDTDDKVTGAFRTFLAIYHKEYEGYMLSVGTIHIIPRQLVHEIGGWRDLKWGEDIDFHKRAKVLKKQFELQYSLLLVERGHNKRSFTARLSEMYNASLCSYKMGISTVEQVKMSFWFHRPIALGIAVFALINFKRKKLEVLE
jgi:hypothetical protein